MKKLNKIYGIGLGLCIFVSGCGDIIKARNPTKKINTPEPESKQSPLYGSCVNFQGRWSLVCANPALGLPSEFFLVQQSCDLVILQEANRSFEGKALQWSESREELSLLSDQETISFKKQNGQKSGTWQMADQTCQLQFITSP